MPAVQFIGPETTGHLTGGHAWDEWVGGQCVYDGRQSQTAYGLCWTQAAGLFDDPPPPQAAYGSYKWGLTQGQPFYWHIFDGQGTGTFQEGYGAQQLQALEAGEIQNCLAGNCTIKISMTEPPISLSWGAQPIFAVRWPSLGNYTAVCPQKYGQGSPIVISKTGQYSISSKIKGDHNDAIWPQLRIWYDRNRNGRVEDGELETMEEAGLISIGLKYTSYALNHRDGHGNWFAFEGSARFSDGNVVDIWDVFLSN